MRSKIEDTEAVSLTPFELTIPANILQAPVAEVAVAKNWTAFVYMVTRKQGHKLAEVDYIVYVIDVRHNVSGRAPHDRLTARARYDLGSLAEVNMTLKDIAVELAPKKTTVKRVVETDDE